MKNAIFWHIRVYHLRAEIAFQAEIFGSFFTSRNSRPKFFRPEFQAEIPGRNFKPKFQAEISGQNSRPKFQAKIYIQKSL